MGRKVSTDNISFVSFSLASLPSDSCPLSSSLSIQRSRTRAGTGRRGELGAPCRRGIHRNKGRGGSTGEGGVADRRRAGEQSSTPAQAEGGAPHQPAGMGQNGAEGTVPRWDAQRPPLWEQNEKQNSL